MFLGTFTPPWWFILVWGQLLFHSHSTTVGPGVQDAALSACVRPVQNVKTAGTELNPSVEPCPAAHLWRCSFGLCAHRKLKWKDRFVFKVNDPLLPLIPVLYQLAFLQKSPPSLFLFLLKLRKRKCLCAQFCIWLGLLSLGVEFIRLTLECPWDVGPLPTTAGTTQSSSAFQWCWNGGLPVGDNIIPAAFSK